MEARIATARANPPASITLPGSSTTEASGTSTLTTPRANGSQYLAATPGLAIGLATPGVAPPNGTSPGSPSQRPPQASRPSAEKDDYFSNAIQSADSNPKPAQTPAEAPADDKTAKTPNENGEEKEKEKEKEKDNGKSQSTPFGKKLRMGMSFGGRKLGRSASSAAVEKPVVQDEKAEESEASSSHEKEVDDCFLGAIQRIYHEYEKMLTENPDKLVETKIAPSLANETPVLKLPPGTKVIIQEETSGGSAEVYRGTVATAGADADIIEQRGPMWLGEVLLTNTIPLKDPVKVSFVLSPYEDSLPAITAADGNNRLNANRMLRVKKILAYVAERIDPPADPEHPDPDALKPEEYLELYCNEQVSERVFTLIEGGARYILECMLTVTWQLLPNDMSLATLRAHVWKSGNDIILKYKANGRKEIPIPQPAPSVESEPNVQPS